MMNGVEVYNLHAKVGVFVKPLVGYANNLHLIAKYVLPYRRVASVSFEVAGG
jgi:hypothetical protein